MEEKYKRIWNGVKATELVNEIRRANQDYRNGTPSMSDTEYDNLLDLLKERVDADVYSAIRESLMEESGNVKHPYVMGSLDKIKAFDSSASVSDWIAKHVADTSSESDGIFVSSKIDGCSARLTYCNGMLVSATTRGDSVYGTDISAKASFFVPTVLSTKFSGNIRGEVTLTKESFELYKAYAKKNLKNLRNATIGLINSKESTPEEVSFLRFFAYEIMGDTGLTKKGQFEKLEHLGFKTALHTELTDIFNPKLEMFSGDAVDKALLSVYNDFSSEAPFDIDGLVVSDRNNSSVFENIKIPTETVAVKFNQMTATTKLIDILWNVSKSGNLHPVAVVDMVKLGGAEIVNATLNNIDFMKSLGLTMGCTVTLLKSGDVIPKVVGVSHPNPEDELPIEYPKICPSCHRPLVYEEDALYPKCVNPECDDIVHHKILHFITQLGIKHVSMKTIAAFRLRGIADLLTIKPDRGVVKSKFCDAINKNMFGASKEKLLSAFDYDGVSDKIIDRMVAHYGYDRLVKADYGDLSTDFPKGVGEKFLRKFCDGFENIRPLYESILNDDRYHGESPSSSASSAIVGEGILQGKGFVVTGPLETMSREDFKATVIRNGGVYQSGVSKNTSYLVCNDVESATTKVKKATSLGVSVINEQKFLNMLKDGSDGFAIF